MALLDSSGQVALRESGARALVLAAAVASFELAVRTLFDAAHPPDAVTALLDVTAHLGRVAPLVPAFAIGDLTISALASVGAARRLTDAVALAVRRLTQPARAFRVLALSLLAWPILAKTLARPMQLPIHVSALYAAVVAVALGVIELVVAAVRRETSPARIDRRGAGMFAVAFGLLATAAVPFVVLNVPVAQALVALPALCFGRAVMSSGWPRPNGRVVALGFFAAGALLVLDVRRPELRRFESEYAPFSRMGLRLAEVVTDLDGDGISGLVGLDCNDRDPDISPDAADIPDDGIDQNCRGGDGHLGASLERYEPDGIHAPSPTFTEAPAGRRPTIVLVSVDAWRADTFDASLFPRTSAWADRCVRFSNARATAPYTASSIVTLHTGVFGRHVLSERQNWWVLSPARPKHGILSSPPTLAAGLAVAGQYRTAVVFPPVLPIREALLTGYEVVDSAPDPHAANQAAPPAELELNKARAKLRGASPEQPVHLRVHLMDLHTPYRGGGTGRSGYLAAARSLDAPLADFLSSLPADAVVLLTADHGEAFGEHGYTQHSHTVFDEELRVPFVLCAPQADIGPPRVVDTPISLVDVTPTLFDLAGVEVPYRRHGESLVPLLRGGTRRVPWVFAENLDEHFHQIAIVRGCDKWMEDLRNGWSALFDVCEDPHERRDRSKADPARAAAMQGLATEVIDLDLDAFRSWRLGKLVYNERAPKPAPTTGQK